MDTKFLHTVCGITALISSMCVSKHSSWMDPRVSLRIENASIRCNFSSHKRDSILQAAHLPMFKVRARISFPITLCDHRCLWLGISRCLKAECIASARLNLSRISCLVCSLVNVCSRSHSASFNFLISISVIIPFHKQKTLGFLSLGSLEVKM